jgi:hypothetical protein
MIGWRGEKLGGGLAGLQATADGFEADSGTTGHSGTMDRRMNNGMRCEDMGLGC